MKKRDFGFFLLFLVLFTFVFRSLLLHFSTDLPDWRDYALFNWVIHQNIGHILSFQFTNFFSTNAFYPHPYSLFFTDTVLPQSIIGLPFSLLTNNPIITFNAIFVITFILNYFSSFIFWHLLFKKSLVAFLGALLVVFSPFFHIEFCHFQMMSYWPFFLTLYFLFRERGSGKKVHLILSAIFFSIQFLASVYIFVFLSFTIALFFLWEILAHVSKTLLIKKVLLILLIFIAINGVFIKGYYEMKQYYGIQRKLGEYVTYSAPISDYIFTKNINSFLYQQNIFTKWNIYDKNFWGGQASFPGFLLTILSLIGLIKLQVTKKRVSLNFSVEGYRKFFLILGVLGFVFSLGPRVNFNGAYAHIPLPYTLILKLVPMVEATRAVSRWEFLFYLALIYFTIAFIAQKYSSRYFKLLVAGVFILFFIEYIPLNLKTQQGDYINKHYELLHNICLEKKQALLEIPITHLDVYPDVGTGVQYISTVELSSIYHKCYLINGYSGYDMPSILTLSAELNNLIQTNNSGDFLKTLKSNYVNIVKFNYQQMPPELRSSAASLFQNLSTSSATQKIDDQMLLIN